MNINQLRRQAVLAAEYVLADLDLADGTKIPIFDLIEDRGIWLSFQPLERLLGIYQRIGNVTKASRSTSPAHSPCNDSPLHMSSATTSSATDPTSTTRPRSKDPAPIHRNSRLRGTRRAC